MAHRSLTNGLDLISMLAIGKIIKKMVLEFSTIKMEISIKVDGLIAKGMVKEHFGSVIQKINFEDNIQEIGKMIKKKVEGLCFSNQVIDMMVCGWIVNLTEKEE